MRQKRQFSNFRFRPCLGELDLKPAERVSGRSMLTPVAHSRRVGGNMRKPSWTQTLYTGSELHTSMVS